MSASETLTLVKTVTARSGYMTLIGAEVIDAEPGAVTLALNKRDDLLQFSGFFHAGAIAGLADQAAGGAASTALKPGHTCVTINFQFDFIAPAKGERLVARARAIRSGSTISVVRSEVFSVEDGAETICALATVTLRAVPLKSQN